MDARKKEVWEAKACGKCGRGEGKVVMAVDTMSALSALPGLDEAKTTLNLQKMRIFRTAHTAHTRGMSYYQW